MKYLLMLLMMMIIPVDAFGQESCKVTSQDVNTPVPLELKDAKIVVRTKDGKEREVSANDFKVVPRKQQFKIKETVVKDKTVCAACVPIEVEVVREVPSKENKNLLMLGVARDYTDLSLEQSGNQVKVFSNKGLVFDLSYYRSRMFESNLGLGLGINTNGAPRGFVGLEF